MDIEQDGTARSALRTSRREVFVLVTLLVVIAVVNVIFIASA
jgi:hypothetical protein